MSPLPIVWVPGHLCGGWLYAAQIAAFPRHPAIVADVGRDDTLAAMAWRLLAAAPERFVIAGLSMGGMVAMEAMAAAPERIAAAVLMDTDPLPAREKERAFREDQRKLVAGEGLEAAIRPFAERFFGHDPAAAGRHLDDVVARMAAAPVEVYERQALALDTRREMVPELARFVGPVAVIVGADDVICPPKVHGPLAGALPAARLSVLPGVGHLACIEAPEAVNAEVAAVLAGAG
ncbi:MAG TPA: alpha/beta hydrolase [Thermohalobaculum sp.]|nr:alpha/beta hydrolase [Thermohalobaculum sp.]